MKDQFKFTDYIKNNPLLKENFPTEGSLDAKDIDYDTMSYFARTHRELVVTLKNGERVESSVGPLYKSLVFHGEFPKEVADKDWRIQLKYIDKVEIVG